MKKSMKGFVIASAVASLFATNALADDKAAPKKDDGLAQEWHGRVWLNPPYGSATRKWIKRLREHGNGIAFIYTRTETEMFFDDIWSAADAVFFFKGRIACHRPDGTKNSSPASASCLIAYGAENVKAIHDAQLDGQLVIRAWAMVPNT